MQKIFRMKKDCRLTGSEAEELECALCRGVIHDREYYYRLEGRAVCEFCLERFARQFFSGERRRAGKRG